MVSASKQEGKGRLEWPHLTSERQIGAVKDTADAAWFLLVMPRSLLQSHQYTYRHVHSCALTNNEVAGS